MEKISLHIFIIQSQKINRIVLVNTEKVDEYMELISCMMMHIIVILYWLEAKTLSEMMVSLPFSVR